MWDIGAEALPRMLDVNVVGTALGMMQAFRAMQPGDAAGQGGAQRGPSGRHDHGPRHCG
ncbi:hypothetical protein [Hydrogenophaga sp. PAMC20947]|uniref:hypothetical protein n=1 Tax=Hydrogenophaga sp. PAMC20947 TaxID=2565558 RepID=UPI00249374FF|nr:hypothetical protein [Hydrogenophaga sp. PAMC20947]